MKLDRGVVLIADMVLGPMTEIKRTVAGCAECFEQQQDLLHARCDTTTTSKDECIEGL